MKCLDCREDSDLATWLDNARGAVLFQKWVACGCPGCSQGHHMELNGGDRGVFGELDGAPGPCLIPTETKRVAGLSVSWDESGVTVEHNGQSWHIGP